MCSAQFTAMLRSIELSARGEQEEQTMTLQEFCIVCGACCGLAVLRFGLPLAITWLVSKAANRLTHAS